MFILLLHLHCCSLADKMNAVLARAQKSAVQRLARVSKKFRQKYENDAESDTPVEMDARFQYPQETETKPTALLVFADASRKQSENPEKKQLVTSVDQFNLETRGAAALQLFLLTYISPVEICLTMLTCYKLDGL